MTIMIENKNMTDYLQRYARQMPGRVAYRMIPSGLEVTWQQLEARSRQCAAALMSHGLEPGDVIAVFMENNAAYVEIVCAAQRAGLYYTPISRSLKANEVQHILSDSGAKAVFYSARTAPEVPAMAGWKGVLKIFVGSGNDADLGYAEFLASQPSDFVLPSRPMGADFSYSSGTTGAPKGIKRSLELAAALFEAKSEGRLVYRAFDTNTVYMTPAPLYHSAPLRYTLRALSAGGQVNIMEKFDALVALESIERYRVTHSQWVPTMFKRMLALPAEVRGAFDLSSMRYAIHTGAPCPVPVKEQMIEWWGPILYEYYAGTEVMGRTSLSSQEWLEHRGSVGLPEAGQVHIVGEDDQELGPRQVGLVYFSGFTPFEYHNDPEKTRKAYNDKGWGTYGDVGYVDESGYLYLTDRASNMIVSGGVNIYPEEVEQVLATHPLVDDVAVIGVPNEDFGEEVKAIVQLSDKAEAGDTLALELISYCRERLSSVKCPRSVDFTGHLPRTETGKLIKRELKKQYWGGDIKQIA